MESKRSLIVNADDYALSPGVSRGILEAHARGVVTSTTALVNTPEQTQVAAEAAALTVGEVNVNPDATPFTGSEDFSPLRRDNL